MIDINYSAPPTCAKFMQSKAFMRVIAGPVGSGKTTACMFELLRRACEQEPDADGIRKTRFAIVRQTLSQLKLTILKDILMWFGPIADYKVSEQTVHIRFGDVVSEWLLIPLDTPEDQRRLLSSQLTGAWLSEAIEMDVSLTAPLAGRCGRYPPPISGTPATWAGMIADTNMPTIGSDWHKYMADETPPDWDVYTQPSGLSPEAENLEWLLQTPDTIKLSVDDSVRRAMGRTYYERLERMHGENWVRRYVYAEYGDDPSGTAVFRESFKHAFHVVDELEPVHGHVLIVGQDFGRDPCSIICQLDHKGRLLVLEEVMAEDIGLELHVERALRPALSKERYFGKPVALIGDPAGRSKSTIFEDTSFDVLKRMGFMAYPAPTNDIDPRLRSVEHFLNMQRDGGPAFLIDKKRCPQTVKALGGEYRFKIMRGGNKKTTPDKNDASHVMDSLQYACLAAQGGMMNMIGSRLGFQKRYDRPRFSARAWT